MDAKRVGWWGIGLALAAGALVLVATAPNGIGRTPDSMAYLFTSDSLLAGRGLLQAEGRPLITWPPAYPVALALVAAVLPGGPLEVAPWFNALCFAGVIVLGLALARRYLGPGRRVQLVGAFLLLGVPLLWVTINVWSEPLFIVLVLGWLLALRPGRPWLLAAGLAALASMTRYAGGVLILSGLAVLLLAPGRRWRDLLGYAVVSTAPLALWLYRNWLLSGTLTGGRIASAGSLPANITTAVGTMAAWFFPIIHPAGALALLAALAGVILAGARLAGAAAFMSELRRLAPLLVFVAAYVAFIVASATAVAYDPIDNRLLAPAYVPALVLVLALGRNVLAALPAARRRVASIAMGGVVTLSGLWVSLVAVGILARAAFAPWAP